MISTMCNVTLPDGRITFAWCFFIYNTLCTWISFEIVYIDVIIEWENEEKISYCLAD